MKKKESLNNKKQFLLLGGLLSLIVLSVVGYIGFKPNNSSTVSESNFQNVTVADLADAQGDYFILDVREQWEYDEVHVPGVTLIPLGELETRMSEIPDTQALYVICRSGNRSMVATDILLKSGKKNIRNVQGGTLAWVNAGFPVE